MNVIWSPEALEDVEEAIDYLVERSPPAAERLAAAIIALVERLATEQLEGPEHVLGNGERVHGWPLPPFRISTSGRRTSCVWSASTTNDARRSRAE